MSDLTAAALRWLADHHSVITSRALRDAGVGRSTVDRLIAAGVLRRVAKGVYVIVSAPTTLEQRCVVLCAAHPTGFITGPTAGALAGLRRMPRTSSLHFAVLHGAHLPTEPGVQFRQTTILWELDRNRRPDGIVTASWARLAFDLAADLRAIDHLSVVNQLLYEHRVTVDELVATGQRLGHPARRGSTTFRRTLEALDGSTPGESHPEVVLAEALRRRGVPVEPQVRVVRPTSGVAARIDLAVPAACWGIELDIHPEHRSLDGHAADAVRRRDLHHMAWQIETVTEADMQDPERIAAELETLYHARRRQLAGHPSVS
jgi:hypothetical protein